MALGKTRSPTTGDEALKRETQRALAQLYQPPPTYIAEVNPTQDKIYRAIKRASDQLPFSITRKIQAIRFGPEGVNWEGARFEVAYTNGKVLEFTNLDEFPTDADIARIALEAP